MSFKVLQPADQRVYLDYNASTPPAHFLLEKWPQWMSLWGNPSSSYHEARQAKELLWKSREQVAQMIHCRPLELVFTSGGSEANNHAIKGLCEKFLNSERKKIITSSVEHPSVDRTMQWAEKKGFIVEKIPCSKEGQLSLEKFKNALDEKTAFVSIMYANNETGCIFPIKELTRLAKEKNILFHCDAVQALGKKPLDVEDLGVDLLSLSAHKCYAFKGCGVLYCKKGLFLENLIHGGSQERKRRAGTENILPICAFGAVAEHGSQILEQNQKIEQYRDQLEETLQKEISDLQVIGKKSPRIGNSSSLWISGVFAETVMMNLDLKGYSVSVSSACHSGSLSPSPVLLGMGYSSTEANCVLRVSLGLGTEEKSLKDFVFVLKQIVERLRKL